MPKDYNVKIWKDGSEYWYSEYPKRHRENGPAAILPDGTKKYYLEGKLLYTQWGDGKLSLWFLR